ncbi:MAG: SDR family oxidoreductase [Candidatus Kerfeldbacteria bacterium]|nr:SDR family oxidoreductase [Candidatus Kerfeldbacteria bacterium]
MQLNKKIIVITGASKGLGSALAEAALREGARVVRSARVLPRGSSRYTPNEIWIRADVTKPADMDRLAKSAIKHFGTIDIWINNAGVRIPHGPIEKINIPRMHRMMEVNLFGMLYGSRTALNHMKRRRQGTIINILSTSALTGRANSAAYCASKYAATGFTKSLRLEAAPKKISVIGVYPGGMRTNFFDEQRPADYDKYMNPAYVAERIIANLKRSSPREELIIKRT